MIDAYRLTAESRDVDVILNGILDAVARLVVYDAAGVYVLRRSNRRVHHWLWRGDRGPARGRRDPIEEDGLVARAIERGEPVLTNCAAGDETVDRSGFESCLVVPIVGLHGAPMGAIELRATRPTAFDARAVEILQLLATVVAGSIERARLKDEVRDKHRIDSELLVAREVMEELIPSLIPPLEGFDIAGVNEASFEVGGDYYEFIRLPDDRWGIIIADVVGKGIGAALLVSGDPGDALCPGRPRAGNPCGDASRQPVLLRFGRGGALRDPVLCRPRCPVAPNHLRQCRSPAALVLRRNGEVEALENGGFPLGMFENPRYFEGSPSFTKAT